MSAPLLGDAALIDQGDFRKKGPPSSAILVWPITWCIFIRGGFPSPALSPRLVVPGLPTNLNVHHWGGGNGTRVQELRILKIPGVYVCVTFVFR